MLQRWDYESPFVRDRLDASLKFVQRFIPSDFSGAFVEIGAYNGDFTKRLLSAFEKASVSPSDISAEAWPSDMPLSLQKADMLSVNPPESGPTILLMLECLYYLSQTDRAKAVKRLTGILPGLEWAFISGPLTDQVRYFDEQWLIKTLSNEGLTLRGLSVLNTTDEFSEKFAWNADRVIKLILPLRHLIGWRHGQLIAIREKQLAKMEAKAKVRLRTNASYRKKYAGQVIYAFARQTE